ncbi:MAG TPA: anion permease [Cyanobacteria bacterium UBA9971]|nr:anion permease [Cyanobacteria bacterium UBA9971]
MDLTIIVLIIIILLAVAFEYINGFHDSANAIATVVSTKALTPRQAIIYAAVLNLGGALLGTHVAKTIGGGIVDASSVTQTVIACALIGAIIWNLFTWYFGIPSSSSHALIGGLMGAAMMHSGYKVVKITGLVEKVLIPMVTSPVLGIFVGFTIMLLFLWIFLKSNPEIVNRNFKKLQLISSGFLALSHGSNDAQKTMGIITLLLLSSGYIDKMEVPLWVILLCALTMAFGTMAGGWKIIRTMGSKIIKVKPIHGFSAEVSSASIILTASHFGIPVSTTHIISTSIMGVGSTMRASAVRWGIVGNIVTAWIVTIPACMFMSALSYIIVTKIAHLF